MTDRLAIDGGRPVRAVPLPYGRQSIGEDDVAAVVDALRSDWLTTGPRVGEFEEALAAYVGAQHAVAVSSGTAGLHAAVFAAGLSPGDQAVTTPLTFAATANAVLYQGAEVSFADVRPDTLNLDHGAAARAITPRTRALLAVDYGGQPADLDELSALADRHGLTLIEDAAHALGATYRGRRVGSIARLTVFSLHPVKHITTGEGGVVTTDDPSLAARLRVFRNHGITTTPRDRGGDRPWFYEMVALGYNYRLTDLQAALGRQQLTKQDGWLARRREVADRYRRLLGDLPQVELPAELPDRESAWHLFAIRLRLDRLRVGRAELFRALRAENIGVNVHYIPVHLHPYYRERFGYRGGEHPVAEDAYERLISLPLFHGMTDRDAEDVVEAVQKVVGHYAG